MINDSGNKFFFSLNDKVMIETDDTFTKADA